MTNKDYCNHMGLMCPYCGAADTSAGSLKDIDAIVWQCIQCNVCGKIWNDVHGLISYEDCDKKGNYLTHQIHE
jgi:uncharacterized Zn finger protein